MRNTIESTLQLNYIKLNKIIKVYNIYWIMKIFLYYTKTLHLWRLIFIIWIVLKKLFLTMCFFIYAGCWETFVTFKLYPINPFWNRSHICRILRQSACIWGQITFKRAMGCSTSMAQSFYTKKQNTQFCTSCLWEYPYTNKQWPCPYLSSQQIKVYIFYQSIHRI